MPKTPAHLIPDAPPVISTDLIPKSSFEAQAERGKIVKRKKGKVFVSSVDKFFEIIESVNKEQDKVIESKRVKEQENESLLAERIAKYEAKKLKKRQIVDKMKSKLKEKKQKQAAKEETDSGATASFGAKNRNRFEDKSANKTKGPRGISKQNTKRSFAPKSKGSRPSTGKKTFKK